MSFTTALHRLNRRDYPLLPKVKIILSVFLITLFSISIVTAIKAHADTAQPTFIENEIAADKSQSLTSWTGSSLGDNIYHAVNLTTNISKAPDCVIKGTPCPPGVTWIPGGMIGSVNQAIAFLYNRPASGIEYIAEMKDNFLGKPVYAQGAGFRGLQPILPLWRGFRNIVYVLSSLVFIFVGIMIMLRVKISPQAVINIQNAIPQIITTLILVTFSYAIAGLLIDLIFFLQGSALAILFSSVNKNLSENIIPGIQSNTFTFATLSQPHLGEVFNLTFSTAPFGIIMALGVVVGVIGGGIIGAIMGGLPGAALGGLIGVGAGPLLFVLIITIVILYWIIKFFFGLVKCYFNIILKIILAPLEIGMGAVPGSKAGFGTWFNDIFANLMVFPISILFLVLANIIINQIDNNLWVPSLLQGSILGSGSNIVKAAVGISVLGLMSKLPEMIPQFIFMIKPSPWGIAIGQSFTGVPQNAYSKAAYLRDEYGKWNQENVPNPIRGLRRALNPPTTPPGGGVSAPPAGGTPPNPTAGSGAP